MFWVFFSRGHESREGAGGEESAGGEGERFGAVLEGGQFNVWSSSDRPGADGGVQVGGFIKI